MTDCLVSSEMDLVSSQNQIQSQSQNEMEVIVIEDENNDCDYEMVKNIHLQQEESAKKNKKSIDPTRCLVCKSKSWIPVMISEHSTLPSLVCEHCYESNSITHCSYQVILCKHPVLATLDEKTLKSNATYCSDCGRWLSYGRDNNNQFIIHKDILMNCVINL
jgi:hypothetical protein